MIIKAAIGQTCPVTGDLVGNTKQIVDYIKKAQAAKVDLIVFPETAITGYCCGALFNQENFIRHNRNFLYQEIITATMETDIVVVVGFVDLIKTFKNKPVIANAAMVIQKGMTHVYHKTYLANDDHHEDKKYFQPGNPDDMVVTVKIKGENVRIATPICEDIWKYDHEVDLVYKAVKIYGADIICVPNYSYFYYGKHHKRSTLLEDHAIENHVPIIYTNCVGVGDIVKNVMVYDGGSMAYDVEGKKIAQARFFEKDLVIFDIDLKYPAPANYCISHEPLIEAKDKFKEIFEALKFAQKEFFRVCGLQKAQVHLSGGIDSAVVAVLAVEAMGKENVIFITNPTSDNSEETISVAKHIADKLGVFLHFNPTGPLYNTLIGSSQNDFSKAASPLAKACAQAVGRTVQGLVATHMFGTGIIACGNHTEIVEGWANFHDIGSIGVHSLIGDLTKVEVFQIAEWINKYFENEIIPEKLYNGKMKPQAELADFKYDPFDYYIRSGICAEMIRKGKDIDTLVRDFENQELTEDFFPKDWDGKTIYEKLTLEQFETEVIAAFKNSKRSVYKAAQAAPQVIISPTSRGFSNRETIINHYEGRYK